MRQIFKAQKHELAFNREGYLILDALDSGMITRMEEFFLLNSDQDFTGCHNSLELHSSEKKAKIYDFLAHVFDDHASKYLNDYRAIAATFVSKKSDAGSVVRLHQDLSFVNESAYTSLNLWVPLCETNADNGMLCVLKGSHKLEPNFRGSNIHPKIAFSHNLAAKYLTPIPMKPGWILFYDHRLFHSSAANRSGRQRTVASISVIPSEATPLHYLGTKAGAIELEVDAGFYHHYFLERTVADPTVRYSVKTDGYRSRKIEYTETSIDEQDLLRLYGSEASTALGKIMNKLKSRISF
jgi:hypothetical protein